MIDFLQSIAPTLLVILGGVITWFLKSKVEELRAAEERLQSDRRKIYSQILEPYILIFSDIKGSGSGTAKAMKKITSFEYKKTGFELNLIGSDNVVVAFNNLITHAYEADAKGIEDTSKILSLLGNLLLEIRKSLGNKNTTLNKIDMLRASFKDINEITKNT